MSASFCSRAATRRLPIARFSGLMLACALSIFAIVVLIATELVMQSQMSWQKFGLQFFYKFNVDPYNHPAFLGPGQRNIFAAVPIRNAGDIAGGAAIAVPLAIGVAIFLTEMCPNFCAAAVVPDRAAGRDSQRGLWAVGDLCAGAAAARAQVNPVFIGYS
jgi:phosphate transport system permease protein